MSKEIISTLQSIVCDELHKTHDKSIFYISEKDPKATWKELKIKKGNFTTLVFSIDVERKKGSGDPIFPFLNNSLPNICSKNDATLITYKDTKLYVFLFELKSSEKLDYLTQLKSGRDFVDYLFAILRTHYNITTELNFFCLRILPSKKSSRKKATGRQKFQFENRHNLQVADYVEPHRPLSLIDLLESAEATFSK